MYDFNCDLSDALKSLQGAPDVDAFVLVDAALPVESTTPEPYRAPVLAAAGVGWRSIPPCISTELAGVYKLDPTTGHPAQAANTVTKVAQRELLRSVKQGEYINSATLAAHLLRAAYQLGWESAPVLSQPLGRNGPEKPCFAFVPVEEKGTGMSMADSLGINRKQAQLVTTSSNSLDVACAKSALVRQYIHSADEDSIGHIFASIAKSSIVRRELLDTILDVVNIQPTKAGGCEVVFKVDPGLFYCLRRVPGFEFVEWGSAVDAGRAGKMFDIFIEVDEAVQAERVFEMFCWVDDKEGALLD